MYGISLGTNQKPYGIVTNKEVQGGRVPDGYTSQIPIMKMENQRKRGMENEETLNKQLAFCITSQI